MPMACSSCPVVDSFTIPVLFCRAFFPQLVSELPKQGVTVDSNHVKERVDQSGLHDDKAENKILKVSPYALLTRECVITPNKLYLAKFP